MIEPLESRIAPATLVNPTTLTYTDADGDLVTVKVSKGALTDPGVSTDDFTFIAAGLGQELQLIDFSNDGTMFDGANLSITAAPQGGKGDGLVNVGRIYAASHVLGNVVVDGDLAVIDAGDTSVNAFAVQSLTVNSLGELGANTGAPDLESDLAGSVKSIFVKGNVRGAYVNITGAANLVNSSLGALTIGGSLLGGGAIGAGTIDVVGNLGPVKVGGSVIAGDGQSTGQIGSINGSVGAVTIGGDVIGGPAGFSGYIFAKTTMGAVSIGGDLKGGGMGDTGFVATAAGSIASAKVGGSLIGGAGAFSGTIAASTDGGTTGTLGAVTVGGSVLGGGGGKAGSILSRGNMGAVKIGGDLKGSGGISSGAVSTVTGDIASVSVRGSVVGGDGSDSGSVESGHSLGAVKIGGDLQGGSTGQTGYLFALQNIGAISIGGSLLGGGGSYSGTINLGQVAMTKQTIGAITIGGSVIGAGGPSSGSLRADQFTDEFDHVGAVKVGGDWRGGSGESSGCLRIGNVASITLGGSLVGGSSDASGLWRMISTSIKIGGDVVGGSNSDTGEIIVDSLKNITIAGSIIGGTGNITSGGVQSDALSSIVVGHDLRGGDAGGSDVLYSGFISGLRIGSVVIGGSIIAGHKNGSGRLTQSGAIAAGFSVGSVTVKGSIVGNVTAGALTMAQITARGHSITTGDNAAEVVLKSLTVGGRVENAIIGAGVDADFFAVDADAQIGTVKVGGNWIASSMIAGIDRKNVLVGNGDDTKSTTGKDEVGAFSKIASITIGGQVLGTVDNRNLTYGFGAEEIGSFKVNGIALPLKAGKSNDKFAGTGVVGAALAVGPSPGNVVSDGFAVHVFEV